VSDNAGGRASRRHYLIALFTLGERRKTGAALYIPISLAASLSMLVGSDLEAAFLTMR